MPLLCPRCLKRAHDAVERCPDDGARLVRDRAGSLVDGWRVLELLGVGGVGVVWRAHADGAPERVVALKVLAVASGPEGQRYERGARLAASLEHPHIARTLAFGRLDEGGESLLYEAMELLPGESLSDIQRRARRLPPLEVGRLGAEVLSALEHAHARGVVHRDIKTSNLVLDAGGRVKLVDFGIAKAAGESRGAGPLFPDDETVGEEVTGQQKICGTPEYMAPEQIMGAAADPRSDLYSLGIVLFKLLTGTLPFRGRARSEIYDQHLRAAPPPLPPEPEVPDALAAVIGRALEKSPDDRYQSARAMHDALRAAVGLPPRDADTPLFPTTQPGVQRPVATPAMAPLPTSGELDLHAHDGRPAPATRAPSRRRRLAVGFFVASLVVLATVVATRFT